MKSTPEHNRFVLNLRAASAKSGWKRACLVLTAGLLLFVSQQLFLKSPSILGASRRAANSASENSPDTVPSSPAPAEKSLGSHYLILVNTAIAFQMDAAKLGQFDKSAYDALAVAFWHAYETTPPPTTEYMDGKLREWKQITTKVIWPWVYFNRMMGVDMSQAQVYPLSDVPYFHKIQGADLDDHAGARTDFLKYWQNTIHAAKDSGVPGIVVDLEFYNYYKEYDPGELARQLGKTPRETTALLQHVGALMADTAAEQYPDAILWFLVTGFTHAGYKTIDGQGYYPSPTYVAMGLLDEIQKKHFRLKVISGGEGSLAYCHETLGKFQEAIGKRATDFAPILKIYQPFLELGGTMTLWSERSAKTDSMLKDECGTSTAATVEDLEPYVELMLKSYRYNFIYASGDGGYYAWSPQSAPRFDAVIRKAQARVYGLSPQ